MNRIANLSYYLTPTPRIIKRQPLHTMATHYDAIIIGSGQSGNPVAKAFANAGHKTAVIERTALGGTCVNVGCTPTKTMIASGRAAYMARRGKDYGVHAGNGNFEIDMARVRQRKRAIVEQWNSGSVRGLNAAGVDVIMGEGSFVGDKKLKVVLNDGGEREVSADKIFINVGERPSRPDTSGLDDVEPARVLDSTSIMELEEVPNHLVVLGGGYIGLEFGQLFRRLGSEVTIVQRAKQLVPREDPDIAECLYDILQQDGLTVHLSSTVNSISVAADSKTSFTVNVQTTNGQTDVAGSHILLAAGRVPNTDRLNLSEVGIETTSKGHIVVDDKLQTSVSGVYALGDCHGGAAFTHMSYDDSRIIRTNLLPKTMASTTPAMPTTQSSISRVLTPYVMYTDPQLGHVGLHNRDLLTSKREVKIAKMPMSYVARALETAEPRGMMKVAVDAKTGEILGFTCLGLEGGEIMSIVQTAMMGNLKWWDLEAAVYAHPTLAESLNNLWGHLE
jgi:pyruvate/2-oxoglutarate dehydrogenase complex dihydrolipoamide dehydrogenase (E3) component